MNLFFSLLKQQSLALLMTAVSFSMDKPSGVLDSLLLQERADERKIIFALLHPKEINVLRKTSKQLSIFFSFCQPSLGFIDCNNPYVYKRDYKSILITALYDSNYEIAQILSSNSAVNHRWYRIPGTNYAVYPYEIIDLKNERMCSLKKHFIKHRCMGDPSECTINPFLIGCISRNNERVKKALIEFPENLSDDTSLLHGLNVVINNNDTQTLDVFINHEKTQSYIKNNGASLIIQALLCGSLPSFNSLIASELCDINQENIQAIETMDGFVMMMNPEIETVVVRTVRDVFEGEKKLLESKYGEDFVKKIEEILLKNGAKTVKELAELAKNEQINKSRTKKFFSKVRLG